MRLRSPNAVMDRVASPGSRGSSPQSRVSSCPCLLPAPARLMLLKESQRGNSTLDLTEHGNIVGIPSSLWPRNRASLSHAPSPLRPHTPPAEHRQDPHSTSSVDSEVQALRAIAYNDEKAGLEALHVGAQATAKSLRESAARAEAQASALVATATGAVAALRVAAVEAELQALRAANAALTEQLRAAGASAHAAETKAAELQVQLESSRPLDAVNQAVQRFRRHVVNVPPALDLASFREAEGEVIGKGGCATVYGWQPEAGGDWAVKVDPISYKNYKGAFEPERCADLLPAFLPPHPNVLAPSAWWLSPLPSHSPNHSPPLSPSRSPLHSSNHSPPRSRVSSETGAGVGPQCATGAGVHSHALAALPAQSPGFRMHTLWPRYNCSLWDHLNALKVQHQQGAAAGNAKPAKEVQMDPEDILTIIRDLASALDHLAQHRVCHSDVKPENVCLRYETVGGRRRVKEAVLIDWGLAQLLLEGDGCVDSRGGTWMYKAPEQLTGPPPALLPCDPEEPCPLEREPPHVVAATDVWSLGALMCAMVHGGSLPSFSGLPLGLQYHEVLKWGDRTSARGTQEPFYMTWATVLPPELPQGHRALGYADEEVRRSAVVALLRKLAKGCMHARPSTRLAPSVVRAAADQALSQLRAARLSGDEAV